jgi:hypothetical protein
MVGFAFIDLFFKLIKYFVGFFLFSTMKIAAARLAKSAGLRSLCCSNAFSIISIADHTGQ